MQVAARDERLRSGNRTQRRVDVDTPVARRVRTEPARRFFELAHAAGTHPAPGQVPGDGDVDEPLQEVSFLGRRLPPLVLELLVRGEELACGDQLETAVESHRVIIHEGDPVRTTGWEARETGLPSFSRLAPVV